MAVIRFASAFRESCGIFLQKNRTLIIGCAASASVASVCGLAPRVGLEFVPSALFTHFFPGVNIVSQRSDVVDSIRKSLSTLEKDQYIVVSGEKGVGNRRLQLLGAGGTLHDPGPQQRQRGVELCDIVHDAATGKSKNLQPLGIAGDG